ncbi:type I-E CRISPR-associated protein Cse2/CasB [Paeniglutamicibacter cryotolerans]|uniref:CRISPR system Cascade subunit CasB n=1 Tax=Paeniglutamicibacter cryotolerans TaxID=670079 RepID=A0A839QRU0_9MICC|nr:type I-E CRISPR-associated protein Cse2/CasB [Paeniglutamicibacter cryotolerans]MBB2997494.1 CRISPR system Cascade subunit CasB [Paeniglutamicibacter cryotolerans]
MSSELFGHMNARVNQLFRGYAANAANEVKAMAHLRQAVGQPPGSNPAIWEFTLMGLPERLQGKGKNPSPSEWASHLALCLYAVHQQSTRDRSMHSAVRPFASSIRELATSGDRSPESVKRRFDALATSTSPQEIQHHVGSIIRLLRTSGIAFDYAMFAVDLRGLMTPKDRKAVLLRWGRDFACFKRNSESELEVESPEATV